MVYFIQCATNIILRKEKREPIYKLEIEKKKTE